MEDIPLPDESVDVVISNGVLNLSARKSRALAEIFRVLGPGGRLSMADLTIEEVASVVGKRPGAVKALQRRALTRLRKEISAGA